MYVHFLFLKSPYVHDTDSYVCLKLGNGWSLQKIARIVSLECMDWTWSVFSRYIQELAL